MFLDEGIEGITVKTLKSYVVRQALSVLLVVVSVNVFLPHRYTINV
jgi:hypothetical protein